MKRLMKCWLLLLLAVALPTKILGATTQKAVYVKFTNTVETRWLSAGYYEDSSTGLKRLTIGGTSYKSLVGTVDLTSIKTNEDGTGDNVAVNTIYGFAESGFNKVILPSTVETLQKDAFKNCVNLTSMTLPSSLRTIGESAFTGCTSMTSINLPEGLTTIDAYAFKGCTALTSIALPSTLTTVGSQVFEGCTSLSKATLAKSSTFKELPQGLFYGCTELTAITVPEGYKTIGANAFEGCKKLKTVVLPSSLETIGGKAFFGCPITSMDLSGMPYLTMLSGAFKDMTTLTSVKLPESVTNLNDAFNGCTALASVNAIPAAVTSMDRAFMGCESLKQIELADGLAVIGTSAFSGSGLEAVTIPSAVTTISEGSFSRSGLKRIDIPATVTTIDRRAFYACRAMTEVDFAEGAKLTTIGKWAFSYCSGLDALTLPDKVKMIDKGAFSHSGIKEITITACADNGTSETMGDSICKECPNLETVTVKGGVAIIGKYAFYQCPKLKTLNIETGVKTIAEYAFDGCSALQDIILPETDYELLLKSDAFRGTSAVERIVLPHANISGSGVFSESGVTSIDFGNSKMSGYHTFWKCTRLEEVTLPASLTTLPVATFWGCTNLKTVRLPDGMTALGEQAFKECTSLETILIPSTVTTIGQGVFQGCTALNQVPMGDGVTTIGSSAFADCTALTEVLLPPHVTSVAGYVFANCTSLRTADVSAAGTFAFKNCTSLTEAVVRGDVGEQAFSGCTALDKVTVTAGTIKKHAFYAPEGYGYNITEDDTRFDIVLEEGVTAIEGMAFEHCPYITAITIPSTVETWGYQAFKNSINLKTVVVNGAKAIGGEAFKGLTALTSVTLNEGTEVIDGGAFSGCTGLTTIDIPASVTTIESNAFESNPSLTAVNIPEASQLQLIDYCAFSDCIGLQEIHLPQAVQTIGTNAFQRCTSLTTADIKSAQVIGESAFSQCEKLSKVTLPADGLTTIDKFAFGSCTSLETISIPASVTTIGQYAFGNCTSLVAVNIPPKGALSTISQGAFTACSALKAFCLPNHPDYLVKLEQEAFYECKALESFTVYAPEPYYIQWVFDHDLTQKNTTLYVPFGTAEAYKQHSEWAYFKDYVEMEKESLAIDADNFPDDALRSYLLSQDYGADAKLTDEELPSLTSLVVAGLGIKSMTGVRHLTALNLLDVHGNPLDAEALNQLIKDLPTCTSSTPNRLLVADKTYKGEGCQVSDMHVFAAQQKGWQIQVSDDGSTWRDYDDAPAATGSTALKGDVNGDGQVTISDAVGVVNIILSGGASAPALQVSEEVESHQESLASPE